MPRYEHSIEIAAPPATVWRVMIDVERWPEWTATTRSVRRLEATPFGVGASARLDLEGGGESVWRVTAFEEGRSFVWEATARGLRAIANHVIVASGKGTRVTLSIETPGILGVIFAPMVGKVMRRNLQIEAEGLKGRSEAGGALG